MSEREALEKRLEALEQAQRDTDAERAQQDEREHSENAELLAAVKALREEVEDREMELFGLTEQLKELREALRRAR